MTAVDEQTDAIGHLDFEDPCTFESCDNAADFSGHCNTCDAGFLICVRCFNRFLDGDAKGNSSVCKYCGRKERHLLTLVRIRPLLKHSS